MDHGRRYRRVTTTAVRGPRLRRGQAGGGLGGGRDLHRSRRSRVEKAEAVDVDPDLDAGLRALNRPTDHELDTRDAGRGAREHELRVGRDADVSRRKAARGRRRRLCGTRKRKRRGPGPGRGGGGDGRKGLRGPRLGRTTGDRKSHLGKWLMPRSEWQCDGGLDVRVVGKVQ